MKHYGTAGQLLLAEARRSIWAVRPEFWDSFGQMLALEALPLTPAAMAELAKGAQAAPPRRSRREAPKSAVAILPLQGLITPKASILSMLFGGGGGLQAFRQGLREAVRDDDISAIVLDIDSPGGSSALVEETAADIRAAREVKPVISVANVDAGSAAWWLATQGTEVSVTPSGMVGSVGAFILHLNFEGMNERMGVEPTYISAGPFKVEGNPDEALSDDAAEHLQGIVDELEQTFVRDIATGRGITEKAVRANHGGGRMLTAPNALAAGMVDRVETLEEAVARTLSEPRTARSGRRAENPSDGPGNLPDDKAELEEPVGSSASRKSLRKQDEALADSVIASH